MNHDISGISWPNLYKWCYTEWHLILYGCRRLTCMVFAISATTLQVEFHCFELWPQITVDCSDIFWWTKSDWHSARPDYNPKTDNEHCIKEVWFIVCPVSVDGIVRYSCFCLVHYKRSPRTRVGFALSSRNVEPCKYQNLLEKMHSSLDVIELWPCTWPDFKSDPL